MEAVGLPVAEGQPEALLEPLPVEEASSVTELCRDAEAEGEAALLPELLSEAEEQLLGQLLLEGLREAVEQAEGALLLEALAEALRVADSAELTEDELKREALLQAEAEADREALALLL